MIAAILALALAPAPPLAHPKPVSVPPAKVPERSSLGYLTAGQLADKCNDPSPPAISYCYAYITGIHDAARAYEIWLNQREFCVPASVSQADMRRLFIGYLTAYPDRRSGQAASVVIVALKESYPCIARKK